MFEGVVLAWKVAGLERARTRIYVRYERLANSASTEEDKDALAFEQHMEIKEIDDAIQQFQNDHLVRLAHRYLLEVPPIDQKHEDWEESGFTGKWQLTPKALIELRKAVRGERKARHEMWQGHIIWISSATGLIGALTGLISVTFFHTPK
jgi:hypothetical protein